MIKRTKSFYVWAILFTLVVSSLLIQCGKQKVEEAMFDRAFTRSVIETMQEKFGPENRDAIERGVEQLQQLWTPADGDREVFQQFCLNHFMADPEARDKSFDGLEKSFEILNGVLLELRRQMQWNIQVNTGPNVPVDFLLANFNLSAHVDEDLFKSKIAFFVLLNYPIHSLEDALEGGPEWSRQKWAEVRLAQQFTSRVPAEASQAVYEAYVASDDYISNYNIHMHQLLTEDGERLFPEGLKLITHWGLRDELKSQYVEPDGFARQQMIYEVMKHIIHQTIPEIVIDNPEIDWKVYSNQVIGEGVSDAQEPDTRYAKWLEIFRAERQTDPYYPIYPSKIARRFNRDREIPEETVEKLFDDLLNSREFRNTAKLIHERLGRDLEPFDIWYKGFKTEAKYSETELDQIVAARYPTVKDFDEKIPETLLALGFAENTAEYLGSKIEVDPARGAGHAQGAARRSDNAHLRTRVPEDGMNYKGFNIAIHELGHNVEQVFSLNLIDHTLLEGVPNTAFTEAFAFVFQSRDLQVLGLGQKKDEMAEHLNVLHNLWATGEIAAVALVDMHAWHWLYDHPEATATEFKEAVIEIARDVWNKYYEPIMGHKDATVLAVYSHMIDAGLYLPDYPIGHIIQFQIEEYIEDKDLATEMERMCTLGSINPNVWMQQAVGADISVEPMLEAAAKALREL